MIDLQDKGVCPAIEEIGEYVGNPVFMDFCTEIKNVYNCKEKIEYSSCSWERAGTSNLKRPGKHCVPYIQGNVILQFWLL